MCPNMTSGSRNVDKGVFILTLYGHLLRSSVCIHIPLSDISFIAGPSFPANNPSFECSVGVLTQFSRKNVVAITPLSERKKKISKALSSVVCMCVVRQSMWGSLLPVCAFMRCWGGYRVLQEAVNAVSSRKDRRGRHTPCRWFYARWKFLAKQISHLSRYGTANGWIASPTQSRCECFPMQGKSWSWHQNLLTDLIKFWMSRSCKPLRAIFTSVDKPSHKASFLRFWMSRTWSVQKKKRRSYESMRVRPPCHCQFFSALGCGIPHISGQDMGCVSPSYGWFDQWQLQILPRSKETQQQQAGAIPRKIVQNPHSSVQRKWAAELPLLWWLLLTLLTHRQQRDRDRKEKVCPRRR